MSTMRSIGRQIGQQKNAIRLPGMKPPGGGSMGAMTLKLPPKGAPRGQGPAPTPAPARPTPGAAVGQGLRGMMRNQGVRNAAGTVGRAAKWGVPGGILLNRLIAAMAAQNRMEGNVNQAVGSR